MRSTGLVLPEQQLHPQHTIPEILNSTKVCRAETLAHPPTQANNPGSKNQRPALSLAAEEMPLDFELLEIISVRLEVLLQVFVGNQAK